MHEDQPFPSMEKPSDEPQFDETQLIFAVEQLRSEQNLIFGVFAGVMGGLIGASLWAVITVTTNFQIGWMAVGVGFLVAYGVRTFGKGTDKIFGIVGAVLALLGCLLGNIFTECGLDAVQENVSFFAVLFSLNPANMLKILIAKFHFIDVLFYGIAVYEGYSLSFRRVTESDLRERMSGKHDLPGGTMENIPSR